MRTRRFFDVNSIAVDILKTEDGSLLITTVNGDTRMKLSPENAGVIRTALNEYLGPDDAAKLMDVELSEHEKQMVEIHASSMVQMISSQVALMATAMSSQAAQMVELINLSTTSKLSPLGTPAFDIDPQFSRPSPGVAVGKGGRATTTCEIDPAEPGGDRAEVVFEWRDQLPKTLVDGLVQMQKNGASVSGSTTWRENADWATGCLNQLKEKFD